MKKRNTFQHVIRIVSTVLAVVLIGCGFSLTGHFGNDFIVYASENSLFVNEICAKNTTVQAPDGNYYDWVELYNNSDEDLDISGFGLSDDETEPFAFTFAAETFVPANGYLVVFCDKKAAKTDPSIAGFGLSTDGDTIYLTSVSNELADQVSYTNLESDVSFGRLPDETDTLAYFEVMTPGAENVITDTPAEEPTMSCPSGFYADEFDLSLEANGCEIFYTLDGSVPTTESTLYTGPIHISDATVLPNRLSNYTNISVNAVYTPPTENIEKATVIRAIAVNKAGRTSDTVTATFFVGDELMQKYADKDVISLVTDEKNLFADDTGIYVTGDTYTNWVNSSEYDSSVKVYLQPANYLNRGKEWERPASFQLFKSAENVLSQDIGIRIHGTATRGAFQKSFNLYARSEYGRSKLEYDFYNNQNLSKFSEPITVYDDIQLKKGGTENNKEGFRDKLNQELIPDRNLLTQAMTAATVFLNGEYWGQYEIMEKISDDFIGSHYGIEKDHVTVIKNMELEDGKEESFNEWKNLYFWIRNTDFSDDKNYETLKEKIDIESFIDYVSSNVYISNYDWGSNNICWWKSDIIDSSNPYADGRWRFVIYDTDYSVSWHIDECGPAFDNFYKMLHENRIVFNIFKQLIKNPSFMEQFCQRFLDIANQDFAVERVLPIIDEYAVEYETYTADTLRRFCSHLSAPRQANYRDIYYSFVGILKQFYQERFDYIVPYMKSNLGLTGELVKVTVQNDDTEGSVKLNTLDLSMRDGAWTGKYYTDYDIHVNATPKEGLEFGYFEITNADGTVNTVFENDIDVSINGDTIVKAVYTEIHMHNLEHHDAKEKTCSDDGNIEYWSCSVCDRVFSDDEGKTEIDKESLVIPASHDYQIVEGSAVAATCTEDGKEADQKCSRCEDVIEGAVINKLGHSWGEWTVVKEATATEEGEEERVCLNDPTHKETQPMEKKEVRNGLYYDGGKWKYFENDVFTKKTGIVLRPDTGKYYYVEKGVFKKLTGLAKRLDDGKWYYVENGTFSKKNGVAARISDGVLFYVKNGAYDKTFNGLAQGIGSDEQYYIKNGQLNMVTGVYKADGTWRYYEGGVFTKADGIAQRPDNKQWYYVENGVFKKSTGLAQRLDNKKWYYVEKGVFKKATGAAKRLDNGKWFYVRNGSYTKSTGLAKRMDNNDWYYFKSGSFFKFTGQATKINGDGTLYDVKDGKMVQ